MGSKQLISDTPIKKVFSAPKIIQALQFANFVNGKIFFNLVIPRYDFFPHIRYSFCQNFLVLRLFFFPNFPGPTFIPGPTLIPCPQAYYGQESMYIVQNCLLKQRHIDVMLGHLFGKVSNIFDTFKKNNFEVEFN